MVVHTIHEVGAVDDETALLGVSIRQHPVVDKAPPERIGDEDDDALGRDALIWMSDVGWDAVNRCLCASWGGFGDASSEAIWTGHVGIDEVRYPGS